MATLYFTNSSIIILRSRARAGSNIVSMSATFTTLAADIQPAAPERAEFLNESPGHVFTAYVSTDYLIKEADRLVVVENNARSKTYEVRGVNYWEGAGLLDHQELTIVSEQA